jgi:hypothetical protein
MICGHAPAPRQGSGDQGFDVAAVDLRADAVLGAVPEDVSEGERALAPSQKDVPISSVGVPEAVIGIAD